MAARASTRGRRERGDVSAVSGFSSYVNEDPANVRNVAGWGGGGLLDIGCYLVHTARFQSFQRVQIAGTRGRIELEIPFNAPVDRPCRLAIDRTGDLHGAGMEWIELDVCHRFAAQAEAFAHAILDGRPAARAARGRRGQHALPRCDRPLLRQRTLRAASLTAGHQPAGPSKTDSSGR